MSKCRSCGAAVIWATNEHTGGRMPFDAEPDANGKYELVERGRQDGPVARYMKDQQGLPGLVESERYTVHFKTCPDAERWRKRR